MSTHAETLRSALLEAKKLKGADLNREEADEVINRTVGGILAGAKRAPKKPAQTDEEWVRELEAEPSLKGINIKQEIARAQFWCKQNKRIPTRRFLVNWLNKAERVVDLKAQGATFASGLRLPPPPAPEGWLEWLKTELATISDDHPAHSQLTAALYNRQFSMMPKSYQERCKTAQ